MAYDPTARERKNAEANLQAVIDDAQDALERAQSNLAAYKEADKVRKESEAKAEQEQAEREARRTLAIERLEALAKGDGPEAVDAARQLLSI